MPNRTTENEQDKLDHASHPVTHATPDDLRSPGGGQADGASAKPKDQMRTDEKRPKADS